MFFLSDMLNRKLHLPKPEEALRGRGRPLATARRHLVFRQPLKGPFPAESRQALFAMGNFWSAEPVFWSLPGVLMTAAGYSGGFTPNPTRQEVCTGMTGHAETVLVTFDPARIGFESLLSAFFEHHDPTQGMKQGGDVGTFYRSAIFCFDDDQAKRSGQARAACAGALSKAGLGAVTTAVAPAGPFYYAEAEHQQYAFRSPGTVRPATRTGIALPESPAERTASGGQDSA
ncbi:MAG: peptide-methionine (S)-S-oxide reductase MsrA [Rhizobiaceae bacterium]